MRNHPILMHLCGADRWAAARRYDGLSPEPGVGYIHLSTPDQVHLPANRLYRGHSNLILLCVDTAALDAPLRWEAGTPEDPDGMVFPHLYGPLPATAVVDVVVYRPGPDGTFPPVTGDVPSPR